jgi:hypothetical protein
MLILCADIYQSGYYSVYVQNSTDGSNRVLCKTYNNTPSGVITHVCDNQPLVGRYLRIEKLSIDCNAINTNKPCYLTLCEVIVVGHQMFPVGK